MRFLLDEDSESRALREALDRLGYDFVRAKATTGEGAKDPLVARHAIEQGLVLLTRNKIDFQKILGRRANSLSTHAGVVFLMCGDAAKGARRLEEMVDLLEAELGILGRLGVKQVYFEIRDTTVLVHR